MPGVILDSAILMSYWRRRRTLRKGPITTAVARDWGQDLRSQYEFKGSHKRQVAIVSPVYLEFVAGASRREELELFHAYLEPFPILDARKILREDWIQAERFAERIPRNGRPRDLGDCLIAAIARRFRCEVETNDKGFPK